MTDYNKAFDNNFSLLKNNDEIDFFFTKRKVVLEEDYIDENDMTRKKKKIKEQHNFIAIYIPFNNFMENTKVKAEIKIWGDKSFKYFGSLEIIEGNIPNLLIKLCNDKKLFVNIKIFTKEDNKEINEYVSFINIPSVYQGLED
jgi:hypothetical protein